MTLHALEDVSDAVDATREFLLPVDRGTWLRLAVVVFFIGGGSGGLGQFGNTGLSSGGDGSPPLALDSLGPTELAIIAGVVALLVVLVLGFALIGAAMEFVFVESLRRETVAIRAYVRTHWRRGVRLFGFRLALGLATLATVAVVVGVVAAPIVLGVAPVGVLLLLVAIPVVLAIALAGAVAGGFTTTFVVPTMLLEDCGVLAAWRQFWPTLTDNWKQYVVYALVVFGLRTAAGLLATIAVLLAGLALAIPLGLLALVGVALTGPVAPLGWGIVGLAVLLFVVGLFVLSLLVAVPVQTALRYYGLFVLGDTDASLDVVPDQRRAVRG